MRANAVAGSSSWQIRSQRAAERASAAADTSATKASFDGEMRVEAAMRQAGAMHDRVHPDRIDSLAAEQLAGRGEDPLAGLRLSHHPSSARPASLYCMTIVMYSLDYNMTIVMLLASSEE